MSRGKRRYSSRLKFQVVLEAIAGEKTLGQVAKAYGVHRNLIGLWKKALLERGPQIFETHKVDDRERRIAELERLIGQKEVEIALLRNFLGQSG